MPPKPKLEFLVDPRLELDGVVELLAADFSAPPKSRHAPDFMHPDIPYVREAKKRFQPFRRHPAVVHRATKAMRGFAVGQRGQGLLRLSPLPELAPRTQVSIEFLGQYAGGAAEVDRWISLMRDFARDSRFLEFFERGRRLLDPDLARLRADVERLDYIGKIERYTGLPFEGRYAFVLSPFVQCDTGANIVQRGDDGLADIVSVMGPVEAPGGGELNCVYPRLHARVWHEAAHGVLDNVTELYGGEIAEKAPPVRRPTKEYRDWMHHVREHMVRSVMLRLVAREISEAVSEKELAHEEDCGLPHLRAFKKRLLDYEKDRARWPNVADFYPRLIDALPKPPRRRPASAPARRPDAHHDEVAELAMPFYTQGQRERALWYLDLMLAREKRPSLLLKRAAINMLLGRGEAARKDADAVLALLPKDAGARAIEARACAGASAAPHAGGGTKSLR